MAKQTATTKGDRSAKTVKPVTGRKGRKWPWFLLLLIIVGGTLYGLFYFNYLNGPVGKFFGTDTTPSSDKAAATRSADPKREEPPVPPMAITPPPAAEPSPPPAPRPRTPPKRYYLSLGSCLYPDCLESLQTALKAKNLPMVKRNQTKSTQYFEIISREAFSRQRATEKIQIINRYNRMVSFPYLVKVSEDQYQISFGQFPSQANGIRMQSHLAQLYPQVKVRFLLAPRSGRYTITRVYTGPFTRREAEHNRDQLSGHPLFSEPELTSMR
jgi:hypothetical protein